MQSQWIAKYGACPPSPEAWAFAHQQPLWQRTQEPGAPGFVGQRWAMRCELQELPRGSAGRGRSWPGLWAYAGCKHTVVYWSAEVVRWIKQFGVPPGRNLVEISAHLDRDPAARERAGNGCNTFNCYQACTVRLCIGLLVLPWRSGRARWSRQWGSRRTVELWRTGRAGPPARRSKRMPCRPAVRGSGRRPVPQGPPESA